MEAAIEAYSSAAVFLCGWFLWAGVYSTLGRPPRTPWYVWILMAILTAGIIYGVHLGYMVNA